MNFYEILIYVILLIIAIPVSANDTVGDLLQEFKKDFRGHEAPSLTITRECKLKIEVEPLWQSGRKTVIDVPTAFKVVKNKWHSDTAYLEHGKDTLLVLKSEKRDDAILEKRKLLQEIAKRCVPKVD